MCDPVAMIMSAAGAASAALGAVQQAQQADVQRATWLQAAERQRAAAAVEEQRAAMALLEGEAAEARSRARTARQAGTAQARLAAQGSDLAGSPLDVLGDIAAAGEEEALSLLYQGARDAWEHRLRAADREAEARRLVEATGRVDPTPGILRSLLQ